VVHVAVSVDGMIDGFEPDVGCYYELAASFDEDVTLAGADTILAQEPALANAPRPGPAEGGPLLAVVDGRRRVRQWEALRDCGHWSDVLALRGDAGGRVDLGAALAMLGERGAEVVRVDSGGTLIGALLAAGLVGELSLLVHPHITGGARPWYGPGHPPALSLRLLAQSSPREGLVWARYAIGAGRP
jgi:2,5-diamino-6-(ribosylamino)-4(3H)-pyrimidinone 5'-phosphate reductase